MNIINGNGTQAKLVYLRKQNRAYRHMRTDRGYTLGHPQAVQTPPPPTKARANTRVRTEFVATTHLCDRMMGLESACRTATAASALMKPLISSSTSDHSRWSSGS